MKRAACYARQATRLPEWLYERGIGEARAALVEGDRILEALIDWDDSPWGVGTVVDARLGELRRDRNQGFVILPDGSAAILSPLPQGALAEGALCRVEVMREPVSEGRRLKWPKVRIVPDETPTRPAQSLHERIVETGIAIREVALHGPDTLERAGWSELIEEAASGESEFPGGSLHLSLTPAMALIDVDGSLPRADLAAAGAAAAARAIRRLGITGSIGIDLPTLDSKAARQAAAAAIDAYLPQPFERTAVNGFGFIQIVRRRSRRSIPELLASDPSGAAARVLLRRAERCGGAGRLTITAASDVIARLEAEQGWRDSLIRSTGRPLALQAEAAAPRWSGHVEADHP